MSLDLGIIVRKNKLRKIITVSEVNLSTDEEKVVKTAKTTEEVLAYIEENNIGYESITVKGFA